MRKVLSSLEFLISKTVNNEVDNIQVANKLVEVLSQMQVVLSQVQCATELKQSKERIAAFLRQEVSGFQSSVRPNALMDHKTANQHQEREVNATVGTQEVASEFTESQMIGGNLGASSIMGMAQKKPVETKHHQDLCRLC